MFIPNMNAPVKFEDFKSGDLAINKAHVCDIFGIGGDPACFDPDTTSYQAFPKTDYPYAYDHTIMTYRNTRCGYFIGITGNNSSETPHTVSGDAVYNLIDIAVSTVYKEDEEPADFIMLFDYLIRHARLNCCKLLELRIDDENRYAPFYAHVKKRYGMEEYNGYLILPLQ